MPVLVNIDYYYYELANISSRDTNLSFIWIHPTETITFETFASVLDSKFAVMACIVSRGRWKQQYHI